MGCSPVLSITSPLARYYSDASSFPDYGEKKGAMAKGNLKGLNPSIGPRNNLNRTTGASTTTEHPSKRQKLDTSSPSTVRLDTSIPASNSLPNSQSKRDVWEIGSDSTTDAKDRKRADVASQNEYRHAQRYGNSGKAGRGRIRKGRQHRRSLGASSRESAVIVDDEDDEDELAQILTPAKVVSDLVPSRESSKRQRQPSPSAPPVKRPKTATSKHESIDNSADELCTGGDEKSRTNQASDEAVISSKATKEKPSQNRGDIKRTQFGSEKERGRLHQARKVKQEKPFTFTRAVSGAWSLEATQNKRYSYVPSFDSQGKWIGFLSRLESVEKDGNTCEDVDGDEASLWAMGIDLEKVKTVVHSMTRSKYLIVTRASSPGRPAQLHIEMSDIAECSRMVGLFPPSNCEEYTGKTLEQRFTHNWGVTADRQCQSATGATHLQVPLPNQEASHVQRNLVVAIPSHRESRSTMKLKDQMQGGTEDKEEERVVSDLIGAAAPSTPTTKPAVPSGRQTRRSTMKIETGLNATSPYFAPEPSVTRWTVENADWESRWPKSLVYPATGRSRAVVDAGDIPRLDDGECLNDNIINFYLRWLKTGLQREKPAVLEKVHVFESYFFERLKTSKYQGVRSWTAKIDLLSYDYIVVPVNENFHWYLAIICNVAKALPKAASLEDEENSSNNGGETQKIDSPPKVKVIQERVKAISIEDGPQTSPSTLKDKLDDPYAVPSTPPTKSPSIVPRSLAKKTTGGTQKADPNAPRIITLDSLGNPHPATCKILREYLTQEAKDKKGIELEGAVPGMTAKGIPFQGNGYDCGTYTLAFIENFLKDPDEVSRQLLQKENLDWNVDSGVMRKDIRNLLFTLQQEQQERLEQELAEKKARRRGKSVSGAVSSPAPAATPTASQEIHRAAALKDIASSPSGVRSRNDSADISEVEVTPKPSQTPKASPRLGINTPIQNETLKLVSPLANSDDDTGGTRSVAFFSVKGTPTPKANGVTKQSIVSAKSSPFKNSTIQSSYVEQIPSSDEESVVRKEIPNKAHRSELESKKEPKEAKEPIHNSIEEDGEKPIQRSVELDDEEPRPKSSGSLAKEAGNEKTIQRSVEQDEEKPRPKTSGGVFASIRNTLTGNWGSPKKKLEKSASYEGIDRS